MRRSQPDGVRWEIQARLAGRYAIDTNSVCYRSASAQDGEIRQIGEVTMQTRRTFLGSVGAAAALGVVGRGGLTGEAVAAENGATNINDAERSSADSAAAPDRAEKVLFWVA